MKENPCAGAYPAYKLPTFWKWVDTGGCAHRFELPVAYADTLATRLAANYRFSDASLAMKLACFIVALQPKIGDKPFPLCRRGLAGIDHEDGSPRHLTDVVKGLGFTEWKARVAIQALRVVGFVEQWAQQAQDELNTTWARWRRVLPFCGAKGRDYNRGNLRRAALLYRIGADFVRAQVAERKRRYAHAGKMAYRAHLAAQEEADHAQPIRAFLPDTPLDQNSQETPLTPQSTASENEEGPTMGEKPAFAGLKGAELIRFAIRTAAQDIGPDPLAGRITEAPGKPVEDEPTSLNDLINGLLGKLGPR